MEIKIVREIQRRQYRIDQRAGRFFLSLHWDDSRRLNRPFQSINFRDSYATLEDAQAGAVHLPAAPEWTREDSTWFTQVFMCDSSGRGLSPVELTAVRRQLGLVGDLTPEWLADFILS